MSILERCSWKMVSPDEFVMGQIADRCGNVADIVVLRPSRKADLFLCEEHINEFIKHWGLYNEVRILCQESPWKPCLEHCLHPKCLEYWDENE